MSSQSNSSSSPGAVAVAHPESRGLLRNFLSATSGEAVAKGAAFAAGIVVARVLSTTDFGRFSFILTVISLALLVDDFGLGITATRAIARDRQHATEYVTAAILIGLPLATLTYSALMALAAAGLLPDGVAPSMAIFGTALFTSAVITADWSLLRGYERLDLLYTAYAASGIGLLVAIVAAWWLGASLTLVCAIYAGSFLLRLILTRAFISRRVLHLRWNHNRRRTKILIVATPLTFLAYFFLGIYNHGEIVLLGYLLSPTDLAAYAAGYKLIDGVLFLTAGAMVASILPAFSRLAQESRAELAATYDRVVRAATALLLPSTVMLGALAGPVIQIVYGRDIGGQAVELLQLLAPIEVLLALNFITVFLLFGMELTRPLIVATGAAALTNIAVNLAAVPSIGTQGAVLATLLAALVMSVAMDVVMRISDFRTRTLPLALLATAAASAPVLVELAWSPPYFLVALGGLVWAFGWAALLGAVRPEHLGRARARLSRRAPQSPL